MKKLRVIQWTTGKVGKLTLRGILDDPRLELVGVYAHSADKAGQDAGSLCGRPSCGVKATNDVDALLALKPDTVIYTPFIADLSHAVRLLENGCDVISTNLFSNVGGIQGETERQLKAACEKGQSSIFITGVSPGWINSTVAGLTAVCRDVEAVYISEAADCSVYESPPTWLSLGLSLPEATPEVMTTARMAFQSFYDAVERIAEALDYTLDEIEFFMEHATASQRVDLGWFAMEKDTNAALRGGWNGKIHGKTVIQYKLTWWLTRHLNKDWDFPDEQYHVTVKGEPDVNVKLQFVKAPHWGNHEWDTMTAMPAVNAIFDVLAAPPGILTLKDVGIVTAPAGLWRRQA